MIPEFSKSNVLNRIKDKDEQYPHCLTNDEKQTMIPLCLPENDFFVSLCKLDTLMRAAKTA